MTSTHLRASLALAVTLFTLACGGSDGGPGTTFADSVSTADAEAFAASTASYATQLSRTMNFDRPSIATTAGAMQARIARMIAPLPGSFAGRAAPLPDLSLLDWRDRPARARGLALATGEGCTTRIRGSLDPWGDVPVDENANGIPDDLAITLVCITTDTVAADSVVVETLDRTIEYREIAGSLYGMTVHLVDGYRVQDNHAHHQLARSEVKGKLDIRAPGLTDQASLTWREEATVGDGIVFQEAGESWDNAFTPSGSIGGSGVLPAGSLTMSGRRYRTGSDGNNLSFTIATVTPLKYYSPCAAADSMPPFTAGGLRGSLNGRADLAMFEIGFIGCGLTVISTEGTYDAAAVAAR